MNLKKSGDGLHLSTLRLKNAKYPLYFRPGTDDSGVIIQNLIRKEWGLFRKKIDPLNIIDAGEFIGDVSVFFLTAYPNCKIIALETNKENHQIALQNLEPYGDRGVVLNKALWSGKDRLRLSGNSIGSKVNKLFDKSDEVVEAISVDEIMREYHIQELDILKIDIEGA